MLLLHHGGFCISNGRTAKDTLTLHYLWRKLHYLWNPNGFEQAIIIAAKHWIIFKTLRNRAKKQAETLHIWANQFPHSGIEYQQGQDLISRRPMKTPQRCSICEGNLHYLWNPSGLWQAINNSSLKSCDYRKLGLLGQENAQNLDYLCKFIAKLLCMISERSGVITSDLWKLSSPWSHVLWQSNTQHPATYLSDRRSFWRDYSFGERFPEMINRPRYSLIATILMKWYSCPATAWAVSNPPHAMGAARWDPRGG